MRWKHVLAGGFWLLAAGSGSYDPGSELLLPVNDLTILSLGFLI